MMRVVFAGGGTGGHIYPGVAVARALERLEPGVEFEFWGSGRKLEAEICAKEAIASRALPAAPLPRNPLAAVRFARTLVSGYLEARSRLKSGRVDAVVGLGGFSSFSPVYAASRLALPTLLLEQNAIPGKANVALARRASLVCLTWQASEPRMPKRARCLVTGNPLRRPIVEAARAFAYNPGGGILILGGSTGAIGVNTMVTDGAAALGSLGRPITHQTGAQDFERVKEAYAKAGVGAHVTPYVDDMAAAYASAALVIARAGGTTLSEIALFGLPAILVPYPHHKDNHQMANARVFVEAFAAEVIEERPGASADLALSAGRLLADLGQLQTLHAGSVSLGKPDAAEAVAQKIRDLARGR